MLNKIKIKNFKCFQNKEFQFNSLTFMVGANGVGKSSLIQSILFAHHTIQKGVIQTDGSQFDVELNGPYLLNLGRPQNVISSNADSRTISLNLEFYNAIINENVNVNINYDLIDEFGENYLLASLNSENTLVASTQSLTYLNAERMGPRLSLNLSPNSDWDIGYRGEYTPQILFKADKKKVKMPDGLLIVKDTKRFSKQVEGWLQEIIPGTLLDYKIYAETNTAVTNFKNEKMNTDFSPATNTGFGISYCLPIIVAGLLESTEVGNGIFVIENPEAHLHPLGQSNMGKFLAKLSKAGVQVIVETHSEHIINGARLEMAKDSLNDNMSINFLSENFEEHSLEYITVNKSGELSNWPAGFFDQEQKDLYELFKLKMDIKS